MKALVKRLFSILFIFIFMILFIPYVNNQSTGTTADNTTGSTTDSNADTTTDNTTSSTSTTTDNTTSSTTENSSKCTEVTNPTSKEQCLAKSTTSLTCCYYSNTNTSGVNKCAEVQSSVASVISGTTVTQDSVTYTQICKLDDSDTTIPKTCGNNNPEKYNDCLITSNYSFLNLSYYCCYSKITVSGNYASSCIPTEIQSGMILKYDNGGVDYQCMTTTGVANNSFYFNRFSLRNLFRGNKINSYNENIMSVFNMFSLLGCFVILICL